LKFSVQSKIQAKENGSRRPDIQVNNHAGLPMLPTNYTETG